MSSTKVLVVEDDEIFIPLIKLALRDLDLNIKVINRGNSALDELSKSKYDLVISDYRLPETHGIEILKAAQKKNPSCKTILMSATDMDLDNQTREDLNLLGFLPKPLYPLELRKLVEEAF